MNTILVPIDFSGVSSTVVIEAARLAGFAGGRVILIHVIQQPIITGDYGFFYQDIDAYLDAAGKDARRQFARIQAGLQKRGVASEAVQMVGVPVVEILQQAKKWKADYIVMGSHGHTAFYDLLVGSTASGVLKRATCPVVIVPADKKPPRKGR